MKTAGIIGIIVLILLIIYIWGKMIYNRIKFEFGFRGADLSGLDIQGLLTGGQTEATIKMSAKVVNRNNFAISFSELRAWLYYDGVMMAQTSDELAKNKVTVQANSAAEITDDVRIFLNKQTIDLLKQVVTKQSPKVQYTVKLKIWGIPVSFTDYFIWEN